MNEKPHWSDYYHAVFRSVGNDHLVFLIKRGKKLPLVYRAVENGRWRDYDPCLFRNQWRMFVPTQHSPDELADFRATSELCYCASLAEGSCDFCTGLRRATDYLRYSRSAQVCPLGSPKRGSIVTDDPRTLDVWIESDPDEGLLVGIGYAAGKTLHDCVILDRAGAYFVVERLTALLAHCSPEVD